MTVNLGKMEITEENIFTAELPFFCNVVKVKTGINYPVGAVVIYDETNKEFKPCDMKTSQNGLICVVAREIAKTENSGFCAVFGAVKKENLVKADSETTFTEWLKYNQEEDYIYLLQNSKIM